MSIRDGIGCSLPEEYRILPHCIEFRIPGFEKQYSPGVETLATRNRRTDEWFDWLVTELRSARGRRYLPVCRMSDGEFLFALGEQKADMRLPMTQQVRINLALRIRSLTARPFNAGAVDHYHSGSYTREEWRDGQRRYGAMIRAISEKGILALHLSHGAVPFHEHFFPALGAWLGQHRIHLTDRNYVPFYFVYACLTGPRRKELLSGSRILVINGYGEPKRQRVTDSLMREGAQSVVWRTISSDRSLYDSVDTSGLKGQVDIALVGAGIGKPNILLQLEPLGIPCIDAGFVFEVWADPSNATKRAFCQPDAPCP